MTERLLSWQSGERRDVPRVVTIGVFDGVHVGHQALLARLRAEGAARGLAVAVLTFDPHPLAVVAPDRAPERLTTNASRLRLLRAHGIEEVVALRFDREVAALGPDEFVRRILVAALRARAVVVSPAFRFGAGARGDVAALRRIAAETGLDVVELPSVVVAGRRVSSTRIRSALRAGDVAAAARLLGRPHWVAGTVEHGVGRGRTLGFPTANLGGVEELLPAEGIYAAWARRDEDVRPAAVHVGRRLTFDGEATVEAHLIDFDGDLYGRRLALGFVRRLRDDTRFAGPAELAAQIRRDVAAAREILDASRGAAVCFDGATFDFAGPPPEHAGAARSGGAR